MRRGRNQRGQSIGDYAVLIGLVASAFIAGQMYVSRRVAGTLANASTTILGSVAPLNQDQLLDDLDDNASSTNDSFSEVRESSGASQFHTVVHSENTGSSHSGFVMAEAPGPYLGALLPFDRSQSSAVAVALQVCGKDCDDFLLAALPTVEDEEDGWIEVTLEDVRGGKKTLRFKVVDFSQDGNGIWHATLDTGKELAHFVGLTQEEMQRFQDIFLGSQSKVLTSGFIIEQDSDRLADIWAWMKERSGEFDAAGDHYDLYVDQAWSDRLKVGASKVLGALFGDGGGDSREKPLSLDDDELKDVSLLDLVSGLEEVSQDIEDAINDPNHPIRILLRDKEHGPGLSDEEALAVLSQQYSIARDFHEIVSILSEELKREWGGWGFDPSTSKLSDVPKLLKDFSQRNPKRFAEFQERLEEPLSSLQLLSIGMDMDERGQGLGDFIGWNPNQAGYGRDWRGVAGQEFDAAKPEDSAKGAWGALDDAQRERWGIQGFLVSHWKERQERAEELRLEGWSEGRIENQLKAEGFLSLGEVQAIQEQLSTFDHTLQSGGASGVEVALNCSSNCDAWSNDPIPHSMDANGHPVYSPIPGRRVEVIGEDGRIHTVPRIEVEHYGPSSLFPYRGGERAEPDDEGVFDATQAVLKAAQPAVDGAVTALVKGYVCGFDCGVDLEGGGLNGNGPRVFSAPNSVDDLKMVSEGNSAIPDEVFAEMDSRLQQQPLRGPHGQAIDVAVGGEYDVLTDLVRKADGSAEQIVWVRVDGNDAAAQALSSALGQAPEGRPIGITQREDQYIAPEEMALTGQAGHPQDWPDNTRASWATYPEDFLFMRKNPDAVLPEGVGTGSGGASAVGGRPLDYDPTTGVKPLGQ